jgi:hypothetical protein
MVETAYDTFVVEVAVVCTARSPHLDFAGTST